MNWEELFGQWTTEDSMVPSQQSWDQSIFSDSDGDLPNQYGDNSYDTGSYGGSNSHSSSTNPQGWTYDGAIDFMINYANDYLNQDDADISPDWYNTTAPGYAGLGHEDAFGSFGNQGNEYLSHLLGAAWDPDAFGIDNTMHDTLAYADEFWEDFGGLFEQFADSSHYQEYTAQIDSDTNNMGYQQQMFLESESANREKLLSEIEYNNKQGELLKARNANSIALDKKINKINQRSMVNDSLLAINSGYTQEAMYGIPGQHTFSPLEQSIAETESAVAAANITSQFTAARKIKEGANLDRKYGSATFDPSNNSQYNAMNNQIHMLDPSQSSYILNKPNTMESANVGHYTTHPESYSDWGYTAGDIGTANMSAVLSSTNTFNNLYNDYGAGYTNTQASQNVDFSNAYDSWLADQYDIFSMIMG